MIRRTETTLLDQMKITDVEILRRMELLGITKELLDILASHKLIVEDHIDAIVDEFYEIQTGIDEIALLIGDSETLERLRNAQRKYVIDLFSGVYDSEYVNNRLRIGMVHKRIGVDPKLYLSAVMTLKELIIKMLKEEISQECVLALTLDALDKLLYFDITLVVDTYIESLVGEIETAKNRTEDYAKSLEMKVAQRTRQLEELAKLDPLTNLYNQRVMQEVLGKELAVAKRRQTKLSIVYFDVDYFKHINDNHGHVKGDEVLKFIGNVLKQSVREIDTPCRYGGDEFCLILPECNIENAKVICEKIIERFTEKYPDYSLSVGIAETGTEEYVDGNALIKIADEKMYMAKKENGSHIYT